MVIQSCRGCKCLILEVLVGKPKIMVIQSCRGCECLILEVLVGKVSNIIIAVVVHSPDERGKARPDEHAVRRG